MRHRVDKLMEMALDFSDSGIEEPDQSLHQPLIGQKVVVYIAVKPTAFWNILKDGTSIIPYVKGSRKTESTAFFNLNDAVHRARTMARSLQAIVPVPLEGIVLVAEMPIVKSRRKGDSMFTDITLAAGIISRPMIADRVRPKDIVGVVYPAEENRMDYPIREFVKKVKSGEIEFIPPSYTLPKRQVYGTATPEAWQHAVLRYVHELLNYSTNYFGYLVGSDQELLSAAVIRESSKLGLSAMLHWTRKDFMRWIYKILPPIYAEPLSPEDDLKRVLHASQVGGSELPFYRLMKKFTHNYIYDIRTGRRLYPNTREPIVPGL